MDNKNSKPKYGYCEDCMNKGYCYKCYRGSYYEKNET